jgi:isoamylase
LKDKCFWRSWNCGNEGDPAASTDILGLRLRKAKNLMTLLFLSNGTPMFRAGDEFLQTQGGNNNPYNQDNVTSWLDWGRLVGQQGFYNYMVQLIRFRKAFTLISRSRFWRSDFTVTVNQLYLIAYQLTDSAGSGQQLYVMVNANWQPQNFAVPAGNWKQLMNTYLDAGQDMTLTNPPAVAPGNYLVGERSVVVLGVR